MTTQDCIVLSRGVGGVGGCELRPLTSDVAAALGPQFAAIDPWRSYRFDPAQLTRYLLTVEADAPRFEVVCGGETAGAIGIRRNWLRGPYLQFLGLLPHSQNRGLGGQLLQWFEDEARQRGDRNAWVAVTELNSGAQRFYERFGFVQAARLPDLVSDGVTEILMRKTLTR